jgi:hypothetical protein
MLLVPFQNLEWISIKNGNGENSSENGGESHKKWGKIRNGVKSRENGGNYRMKISQRKKPQRSKSA